MIFYNLGKAAEVVIDATAMTADPQQCSCYIFVSKLTSISLGSQLNNDVFFLDQPLFKSIYTEYAQICAN